MAFQQTKHGLTRTRCQAVRLYGKGYPLQEIQDVTRCSRTSLMEWCRRYRTQGIAGLTDQRRGGNRAKLTPAQLSALSDRLHQYTPADVFGAQAASFSGLFWTVEDLHRALKEWYGVVYKGRPSYTGLLADCGSVINAPPRFTSPVKSKR
jgi:transposase